MTIVLEALKNTFHDYHFLILYGVCLVLAIALFKEKRKQLVIPAVLISLAVINPLFYQAWAKLNEANVYWRTLWMIPVLPICAAVVGMLVEKSEGYTLAKASDKLHITSTDLSEVSGKPGFTWRREWLKLFVITSGIAAFIICGGNVYTDSYPPATFKRFENAEKLPGDVVKVGQALLEIDDHPRVVTDSALSVYLRQYSASIQSPYSRSVTYGSPSSLGREIYTALTSRDFKSLATLMANYDYEYLVTSILKDGKAEELADAGFEQIRQVNGYEIYRNHGVKTEQRTYNERHQVMSVTTIDENGNPVNSSTGYATTEYQYDDHGRVKYEFRRDTEGNAVADTAGRAGYIREYNYFGQMISEVLLGVDGGAVDNPYSKRTCEYDHSHRLIKESYYDAENRLMIRNDTGYASIEYVRDAAGNVTEERTYGINNELTPRTAGYSVIRRTFDENRRVLSEEYYDESNKPINVSIGYQRQENEYQEDGQLSLSRFYDLQGNRVECGSSWFHEYLQNLDPQGKVIFISVRDEGTAALTITLLNDLKELGIQTDLKGKYRNSYYAVLAPEGLVEDISSNSEVFNEGEIGGVGYSIASAGYLTGDRSSIQIDGIDYSKNVRGLNFVIYDLNEKQVVESIAFDTCSTEMKVTR